VAAGPGPHNLWETSRTRDEFNVAVRDRQGVTALGRWIRRPRRSWTATRRTSAMTTAWSDAAVPRFRVAPTSRVQSVGPRRVDPVQRHSTRRPVLIEMGDRRPGDHGLDLSKRRWPVHPGRQRVVNADTVPVTGGCEQFREASEVRCLDGTDPDTGEATIARCSDRTAQARHPDGAGRRLPSRTGTPGDEVMFGDRHRDFGMSNTCDIHRGHRRGAARHRSRRTRWADAPTTDRAQRPASESDRGDQD